ncbi:MAG: N-acetyltransferase [Candidatus Thorarchaeota archaeon]|nr:MAG: N-acetyltransferase [Candidatus Thorarchaeota archaeon]
MDSYTFSMHMCQDKQDAAAAQSGLSVIYSGLGNNIVEKTGIAELGRPIYIFVRNSQKEIVGGVVGQVFGGWLYVSLLWVDKSIRGRGYGTRLMHMAEEKATSMGCTDVHLDTYSFEAKPFYERLGYEVFATLEDYPRGHRKYFLKKRLALS